MTLTIKHRVNTLRELRGLEPEWGAEIDLRSSVTKPGHLHLSHDPWIRGTPFDGWLALFKKKGIRGPLILNTKEDGLEERIIERLRRFGVRNYFFLDTALPTLVKWAILKRNKRFAVRASKYERGDSLRSFAGTAAWAWVDCFGGVPLAKKEVLKLKKHFKICLVSPELQGAPVSAIKKFHSLKKLSDAVCTKRPDLWETA